MGNGAMMDLGYRVYSIWGAASQELEKEKLFYTSLFLFAITNKRILHISWVRNIRHNLNNRRLTDVAEL